MAPVLAVSVTERGQALAGRLPFEAVHGNAAETVRARWAGCSGFVLFLATGAAVRIVAPLLGDKATDPAVVCVDEAGRYAVALCGGHQGGANDLARRVAALIGAEAVVTTATDRAGIVALDTIPGWVASGDVAGVTTAMLDGRRPVIDNELGWPLPPGLVSCPGPERPRRAGKAGPERPRRAGKAGPERKAGPEHIVVTDRVIRIPRGAVLLHPPSLVAGVGASSDVVPGDVDAVLAAALLSAGLSAASVAEVATIDRRAANPAVTHLGRSVRAFTAAELAAVDVPSPSAAVEVAVGTPSVAEAAALLAAGPGAELIVTKQVGTRATVALARRRGPKGHLSIVGLGPGDGTVRTPAAERAVRRADVVIGYGPYVDQGADLLRPGQEVVRSPIGDERLRAKQALAEAASGRRVALVSSGDAGVYAMAAVALDRIDEHPGDFDVEVVPGVTAALAAAALLGAPLGHDHAVISLSDLLTPWPLIETRLRAAAEADLAVALYNPCSQRRTWQLEAARQVFLRHRAGTTPVGVVTEAFRPGQQVVLTTLDGLAATQVGMTTCVIVGSSSTRVAGGRMVTPRGRE